MIRERDPIPERSNGPRANLDGRLNWVFKQSSAPYFKAPHTTPYGCYYAYTELHFDSDQAMHASIGTDDYGKIWINGQEVWQEQDSAKTFSVSEHIDRFQFKKGVNRVLVRFVNWGSGPAGFSLMLAPIE